MSSPKQRPIPWARPVIFDREKKYVLDALRSTWISGGIYVERFEREFGGAIGARQLISVSNGTTALLLAMLALEVGRGDEVIIPGFSFVAPANMAVTIGAVPVFADVDPETWCLDVEKAERAVTKKTRAICAVHTYGNVCDMASLKALCRRHRLALIEDTAEAAFSRYRGRHAGTFGDAGTFSFQATKTLTMGEGGCVAAANKRLFGRMKVIRNHGMNRKKYYWHTEVGHNFRLPNLQAAIGCAQLERIDRIIANKNRVYRLYQRHLGKIPGVTMQLFQADVDPVVWAIALKIDPKGFVLSRDDLMAAMQTKGIETRPGFYPFQTMAVYKPYIKRELPVARDVGRHVLSLPSFPQLKEEQIAWICSVLKSFRR